MPSSRRVAVPASSPPVDATMGDGEDALPGLVFNKPLSWTAGKPIAEAELVKRLTALYEEISVLEPDDLDVATLAPKAKELIQERLIKHKNKGVVAWTCCCIVECLKLFAPHAPYTGQELKSFFLVLIDHIIPALVDSSSPYHSQHLAVLKSLDEVQSILLIADFPGSDNLTKSLFTTSFDVLSGPSKSAEMDVSINVGHTLTALLVGFVKEADDLPDQVIDGILAQFLRADPRLASAAPKSRKGDKDARVDDKQATLLLKEAPAAYIMAQDICNECPDKMARYVSRYFSRVLLDTSMAFSAIPTKKSSRKSSDEQEDSGPSEESLEESRKAHLLMRELWRAAPDVLQDIVPQLETELTAENSEIRKISVETIGDMIAGVGAAGTPQYPAIDPTAYPSQSIVEEPERRTYHFLLTPSSSVSFISRHHSSFSGLLRRKNDMSSIIRASLATEVGKIILTSAGGVGIDPEAERELLESLAAALVDTDDRVRLAAIKAIESFPFKIIVTKLPRLGGAAKEGSVLANLVDRCKDLKSAIRTEAIKLVAKLWGVAAGAIAQGNEQVIDAFDGVANSLISLYYTNDPEIYKALDQAMFESLVPLRYPHKTKLGLLDSSEQDIDPDKLRVERILLLIGLLDTKSRMIFFTKQKQQSQMAKLVLSFLQQCEAYNGGVIDSHTGLGEKEIELRLNLFYDQFTKSFPDKQKARDDLKKFVRQNDRRSYALIRFCCSPESDWARVRKSITELTKKLEAAPTVQSSSLLDTLLSILYQSSVLIYNRSHVPFIIQYARTNDRDLGSVAQEVLTEISKTQGEIFSTHVQELCKTLVADAPSSSKPPKATSVNDLKACVEFTQRYPDKMPQDRKFFQALMAYTTHGQPRASKYAVRILLASAAKKEMYTSEIFTACAKTFKFGGSGFLSKLAALSQLCLYGAVYLESDEADTIVDIAINQVLTNPKANAAADDGPWSDTPDDNIIAKTWALKILVNRLLAFGPDEDITDAAEPVFKFLDRLISSSSQVPSKSTSVDTHASRLRLLAAESLCKLSKQQRFDAVLDAPLFERLCLVAQDPLFPVRKGFTSKVMKYLNKHDIRRRYYTPMFLFAFEPETELKGTVEQWIRSKSRAMALSRESESTFEVTFARLLSLLAHHPDFDLNRLDDMAAYILFYMQSVATKENISLIYNITLRIKNFSDGLKANSDNLYVLSDLAQAIIKKWDELSNWNMELLPHKVMVPAGLFENVKGHDKAAEIASKNYVPEEFGKELDHLVKEAIRASKPKKRVGENGLARKRKRSEDHGKLAVRRVKVAKPAKPAKKKSLDKSHDEVPFEDRRRSGRNTNSRNYREAEESDDGDVVMTGALRSNGKSAQVEVISSDTLESNLSD